MPAEEIPQELAELLARDTTAKARWDRLAPSHQHEFNQWVGDAKRAETRARRAAQALEMIKGKQ